MPVPAESRADLLILLKGQLNEECSKPVGTKGSGGELGGYGHIAPSIGKSQKIYSGFFSQNKTWNITTNTVITVLFYS